MITQNQSTKPPHTLPSDLKKALSAPAVLHAWNKITPLARNEWICWVTSAKKPETRIHRITRTALQLKEGKRRPCCWAGCPHRSPLRVANKS